MEQIINEDFLLVLKKENGRFKSDTVTIKKHFTKLLDKINELLESNQNDVNSLEKYFFDQSSEVKENYREEKYEDLQGKYFKFNMPADEVLVNFNKILLLSDKT